MAPLHAAKVMEFQGEAAHVWVSLFYGMVRNRTEHSVTLFSGKEQFFTASVDIYCSSPVPYSYIHVQL